MSSREFKFRVWDLKNSKWIDNDVDFILTNDGKWYFLGGDKFTDNDIVQQYTGMKDKNGIEIYEGDIVRSFEPPSLGNWEIIFVSNGPSYVLGTIGKRHPSQSIYKISEDCEVIGNIYENPELLNL